MASPARKRFKVTRNGASLTVFPYVRRGKPKWRYGWKEHESDKEWRYVTCDTKDEGQQSAWDKLGEIATGGLVWSSLDKTTRRFLEDVHRLTKPADFGNVIALLETRNKSAEIVASVERFFSWKVANKGEETRHLGNLRRILDPMAASFAGRSVVDIHDADLLAWWTDRMLRRGKDGEVVLDPETEKPLTLSKKTGNDIRAFLVEFWDWAILEKIYPKESTPADKLPRVDLDNQQRRVLTPGELLAVMAQVGEEWRPWFVLGAFTGLRPEEISPPTRKGYSKKSKRGIRCEEIDWRFKVIRLPAEVSKGGKRPRSVPLSEAALAWLEWAGIRKGMTGSVCVRNPSEHPKADTETVRIGREVFGDGWPQDVLRHSYGSYRNALIRNLPQVAEEMGTSVAMLNKHYHNPQAVEEGEEWFALRPEMVRFGPMKSAGAKDSEETARAANA